MSVEIFYEVTGDHVDAGTKCSCVTNGPVSVADVKNCFAYEGEYFFRVKIPGSVIGYNSLEYTWMDLMDDDCDIYLNLSSQKVFLEVKALLVSAPEVEDHLLEVQTCEYIEETEKRLRQLQQNSAPRSGPKSSQGAGAAGGGSFLKQMAQTATQGVQGVSSLVQSTVENKDVNASVQAVSKGMFGLWNSVKTAATSAATIVTNAVTGAPPSRMVCSNLRGICDDLSTTYNPNDAHHVAVLTELWTATFAAVQPSTPCPRFARESPQWKEVLGFLTPSPIADLKTSGLLGLRCLAYMIDRYKSQSEKMILKNKVNVKTNYPFALVGINLSLLLADVLTIRDERFVGQPTGYWEVFEHPCAFFEVFCVCFFFMNGTWVQRGATRADFGKIIGKKCEARKGCCIWGENCVLLSVL